MKELRRANEILRKASAYFAQAEREGRLPKGIVPTDFYGQSVDLNSLEALAKKHGVRLVVDSAGESRSYV